MTPREFAGVVKDYIDERIKDAFTGRTDVMFANVSDAALMLELMARGYAVWKPKND